MADVQRIDPEEFRSEGYLQELNRRFLHPLGLAFEVRVVDGRAVEFGGVWDYRDDPEGIVYGEVDPEKVQRVDALWRERKPKREAALGFFVQAEPAPEENNDG